jgi:DNA invertase Pin-like site-specific DNA recombinase
MGTDAPQRMKPRAGLLKLAREDLTAWARVYAERDERVKLAAQSGLGVNEIARITGLAKTTVLRILRADALRKAP